MSLIMYLKKSFVLVFFSRKLIRVYLLKDNHLSFIMNCFLDIAISLVDPLTLENAMIEEALHRSLEDAFGQTLTRSFQEDKKDTKKPLTNKSNLFFMKARKQDTCPICCDDILKGNDIVLTPCNHAYHKACATKMFEYDYHCAVCKHDCNKEV